MQIFTECSKSMAPHMFTSCSDSISISPYVKDYIMFLSSYTWLRDAWHSIPLFLKSDEASECPVHVGQVLRYCWLSNMDTTLNLKCPCFIYANLWKTSTLSTIQKKISVTLTEMLIKLLFLIITHACTCMHTCLVLNSKVYESYFTFYRLNYLKFSPKFISSFLSYCLLLLLIFPCCLAVSFICFHHFGNSLSWNCDLYSGSGMRELDTYYFCFCWSVWNRSG